MDAFSSAAGGGSGAKPCKVCGDFKSWSKGGVYQSPPNSNKSEQASDKAQTKQAGSEPIKTETKQVKSKEVDSKPKLECPPGYKELGNSTWSFLHTTAAYYPKKPTNEEQENMKGLIKGVSLFYPCQPCAEHMREEMKVDPPKVETNKDLNLWLCQFHNKVNEMLGKESFDCSRVLERWKDGPKDGSCDS
ncbi:hypothetical protein CONCODRAFT_68749 [Conidiobolus coronatus NRRL 28638]|uniref:Sulfhydryl oxidase n=1 Tax=Conidiobolus coronatus (strain ATCC 28846 / CBS 209.66 / NRRL 28638) TaxID=796925 RepID=A0A137PCU9_CONC2|nr:hypothetical protein CONCODRAFT_68749 [Conidiobolus coronatus NRRL 28638]|eukprot:KXN72828.1 hypothetical protein CONCODRAFT_68749 [Conidiobolus coronatus NRRL 28638]